MGRKSIKYRFAYPFAIGLFLVFVLPVFFLAYTYLFKKEELSIQLIEHIHFTLLIKSIILSGTTALVATSIGAFFGFLLYKTTIRFRSFYHFILLIPLLLPPYVIAVAWKDVWIFGTNHSYLTMVKLVFVQTLIYFPLATLISGNAFLQINQSIDEAGLMLMPFKKMIFKILLPLIRPALSISFILIFIFSIGDFSVPAFFGIKTITTEIFTQFSAFYNYQTAIGESVILMLIVLSVLFFERNYLSDLPFLSVSSKGSKSKNYPLDSIRIHLFFWIVIMLIITPMGVLLRQSVSGNSQYIIKAVQMVLPGFGQSFLWAFLGAVFINIIGFIAAYFKERRHFSLPSSLLLMTFIIPSIVYGISLIGFYNRPVFNFLYGTPLIILIGYIGSFSFIASRIIGHAFQQIPISIEEVAAMMGIKPFDVYKKIIFPLLIPSLFASFVIAFILSINELGVTILVYPPGTKLIPIRLFTLSANAPLALTSSMTFVILMVNLILIILLYGIGKQLLKKYTYA